MSTLLGIAMNLPLPGGDSLFCGSIGDCLTTLLQIAVLAWMVFATLGAVVDLATRRKGGRSR